MSHAFTKSRTGQYFVIGPRFHSHYSMHESAINSDLAPGHERIVTRWLQHRMEASSRSPKASLSRAPQDICPRAAGDSRRSHRFRSVLVEAILRRRRPGKRYHTRTVRQGRPVYSGSSNPIRGVDDHNYRHKPEFAGEESNNRHALPERSGRASRRCETNVADWGSTS